MAQMMFEMKKELEAIRKTVDQDRRGQRPHDPPPGAGMREIPEHLQVDGMALTTCRAVEVLIRNPTRKYIFNDDEARERTAKRPS